MREVGQNVVLQHFARQFCKMCHLFMIAIQIFQLDGFGVSSAVCKWLQKDV